MKTIIFILIMMITLPAISKNPQKAIFINKNKETYMTENGGSSWQKVSGSKHFYKDMIRKKNDKATDTKKLNSTTSLLIKNGKKVTYDGGKTWQQVSNIVNSDQANATGFTCFPNPAKENYITLKLPGNLEKNNYKLSVIDAAGLSQTNIDINLVINDESENIKLDISKLLAGNYTIILLGNTESYVTKLVVIR